MIVAGGDDVDDYKKPVDEGYQSFYDSLDSFSLIMLFKESKCTFFAPQRFHFPRTFLHTLIWLETIRGFLQNFSLFISIHLVNALSYL